MKSLKFHEDHIASFVGFFVYILHKFRFICFFSILRSLTKSALSWFSFTLVGSADLKYWIFNGWKLN